QSRFLEMIQIADVGSIYIVAFVIILFNRAVYWFIKTGFLKQGIAWKELAIALSVIFMTYGYGIVRLSQPMSNSKTISVSVIQGNIAQDQKWNPAFREKTLQIYKRLTLSTFTEVKDTVNGEGDALLRPSLVVWPEASIPFIYENEPEIQSDFLSFIQEGSFDLLFGAPAIKEEESGKLSLLNSAYLLSSSKKRFFRYDKMHLVPFGEYVPFSKVLFFIEKLVTGIGDFVPGEKVVVMETGGVQVGTVICFEVIFPEIVRDFVKTGANFMTTMTNDAWFGRSAAAFQHFAMVSFRAIENRVPFARSANTGISGFIDAYGRATNTTSLFVEAAETAQLRPGYRKTLYTTYGDFFAIFCSITILIILIRTTLKRRKHHVL
ncbi:MAG: apolipoprotein N-acyltransferase, partial [Nitrospiria bacterium]